MAAYLNQVELIGNLGADPETRYLPSGDAVANIRLATTESWKDKATGDKKEATEWHRVAFFGKLAEIAAEYLKKGSSVFIQGKIRTRKWTDQAGVEKYSTEIVAEKMLMLGGPRPGDAGQGSDSGQPGRASRPASNAPASGSGGAPASGGFDEMDDDIPF